jgi:protease-4
VICIGSFAFLGSLDTSTAVNVETSGDFQFETVSGDESSENKFLSIPITGLILNDPELDGATGGLFGGVGATYGANINEQLRNAADDNSIKGVVLRINSPGGTVTGSNAISEGINYYQEQTGNPVISICQGVCASGSYWAAAPTDFILAETGSQIGSIGVIFGPFKYYDEVVAEGDLINGAVVTQNGIETNYITGGASKDAGNPYRRLTEREIEILQEGVNDTYDNFVDLVVSNRDDITETELRNDIGALVYSVDQSLENGLIDEVGDKRAAYAKLAELAEVDEDDYRIIERYQPLGFWDSLLVGSLSQTNSQLSEQGIEINQKALLRQTFNSPLVLSGNPAEYLE